MNTLGIALLFVAKSLWDLFRLSAAASVVAVVGAACWCYENFAGILVMFVVLLPLIAYEMTPERQDLITLSDVHEPLAGTLDNVMVWDGEHWVDGDSDGQVLVSDGDGAYTFTSESYRGYYPRRRH